MPDDSFCPRSKRRVPVRNRAYPPLIQIGNRHQDHPLGAADPERARSNSPKLLQIGVKCRGFPREAMVMLMVADTLSSTPCRPSTVNHPVDLRRRRC